MDKKSKPTPEAFDGYEEAVAFWETPDTTDYLNEFRTVEFDGDSHARHFDVEIEEDVVKELQSRAEQGVSLSQLASDLLRQRLQEAA